MLILLNKKDFNYYVDFAYSLALSQKTSSYPTYTDGIKTKEDFILHAKRIFKNDNHQILLFEYDGKVEGWIHYYVLESDKYISFEAFNIQKYATVAFDEFLKYVTPLYKGYTIHFGFPDINRQAICYLRTHKFNCIEQSYVNILKLKNYTPQKTLKKIVPVSYNNFNAFKTLHDEIGSMYWDSNRLYNELIAPNKKTKWYMYLYYENGEAIGNIYFICMNNFMEIFGIDYKNKKFNFEVFKYLTIKALNIAKEKNILHLYLFCNKEEHKVLQKIGFTYIGNYELYEKIL